MKELFHDILGLVGVRDLVFISDEGRVLFQSELIGLFRKKRELLRETLQALAATQEMYLICEKGGGYYRKIDDNHLLISLDSCASRAMVKLHCDILVSELEKKSFKKNSSKSLFLF